MNQGKLDMVKQEMAREDTDIFKISELKWMGMDKFNSYDQYIYYCRQESVRNAVLRCNLKNDRMISVHFTGKPFSITVIKEKVYWGKNMT